jgi:hypothetical protein
LLPGEPDGLPIGRTDVKAVGAAEQLRLQRRANVEVGGAAAVPRGRLIALSGSRRGGDLTNRGEITKVELPGAYLIQRGNATGFYNGAGVVGGQRMVIKTTVDRVP